MSPRRINQTKEEPKKSESVTEPVGLELKVRRPKLVLPNYAVRGSHIKRLVSDDDIMALINRVVTPLVDRINELEDRNDLRDEKQEEVELQVEAHTDQIGEIFGALEELEEVHNRKNEDPIESDDELPALIDDHEDIIPRVPDLVMERIPGVRMDYPKIPFVVPLRENDTEQEPIYEIPEVGYDGFIYMGYGDYRINTSAADANFCSNRSGSTLISISEAALDGVNKNDASRKAEVNDVYRRTSAALYRYRKRLEKYALALKEWKEQGLPEALKPRKPIDDANLEIVKRNNDLLRAWLGLPVENVSI